MESLLKGIPNVSVYLDDILVSGSSDRAHLDNLESVLSRLEAAGFQLKQSKCMFFLPEVEYLGHRITPNGLHPTPAKVKAITAAPPPKNMAFIRPCKLLRKIPDEYGLHLSPTIQVTS